MRQFHYQSSLHLTLFVLLATQSCQKVPVGKYHDAAQTNFDATIADLSKYDAQTIFDSSNDATVKSCAAQNAKAEGLCDATLGIFWTGTQCEGGSGCKCIGPDCNGTSAPFNTMEDCQTAYAHCIGTFSCGDNTLKCAMLTQYCSETTAGVAFLVSDAGTCPPGCTITFSGSGNDVCICTSYACESLPPGCHNCNCIPNNPSGAACSCTQNADGEIQASCNMP